MRNKYCTVLQYMVNTSCANCLMHVQAAFCFMYTSCNLVIGRALQIEGVQTVFANPRPNMKLKSTLKQYYCRVIQYMVNTSCANYVMYVQAGIHPLYNLVRDRALQIKGIHTVFANPRLSMNFL